MKDLNRYVIKKHANMWKDIGIELGLELKLLNVIEKDHPYQSVTCLQEVLDKWLMQSATATWKSLELALTNVTRVDLGLDPCDDIYGNDLCDVLILFASLNFFYFLY